MRSIILHFLRVGNIVAIFELVVRSPLLQVYIQFDQMCV